MPTVGFEPMVLAGERPQTYALDREATGTGNPDSTLHKYNISSVCMMCNCFFAWITGDT